MSISKENIYKLEGRVPLKTAIPLGMQHVLAMYAGNLAPILVISGVLNIPADIKVSLLQSAMFVAGAVTFVQLRPIWKIGSGLPTVMGTSSGFIPVAIGVGLQYAAMGDWSNGYAAILGASLIGGLMEFMLGFIVKPLRKFLPHVVTGTVVTTLGISLIPVGIKFVGGGVGLEKTPGFGSIKNLLVALFVFLTIIFIRQMFTGFLSISSILIGLIAGYIVAIFAGMVDFTPVRNAAWISAPLPFFAVGHLNLAFHWDAIVPFLLVYLATTVETIGDNTGIAGRSSCRRLRQYVCSHLRRYAEHLVQPERRAYRYDKGCQPLYHRYRRRLLSIVRFLPQTRSNRFDYPEPGIGRRCIADVQYDHDERLKPNLPERKDCRT